MLSVLREGVAAEPFGRPRGSADVHELDDDPPTGIVDRIDDASPPGDLLVGVDAGRQHVALPVVGGLGALGDDERGRGALGVVLGVQLGGHALGCRAVTGHRRHREAVIEMDLSDGNGLPEAGCYGH